MKKNIFLLSMLAIIVGLTVSSCGNDDKDTPDDFSGHSLRIVQIDWLNQYGDKVWKNFKFDAQGRIISYDDIEDSTSEKCEFQYSDNLITEYWEGTKIQNYILEDGLIVELRSGSEGRGFNYKLKYNSNKELVEIYRDDWKQTFNWSNGLLISSIEVSDNEKDKQYDKKYTFSYSNYANKLAMNPYAFSDDDIINPFLNALGFYGKVPTLLPSKIDMVRGNETYSTSFSYTIGTNGYPTKFETIEKYEDSYGPKEYHEVWSLKWN